MDRTLISWNLPNLITIPLMAFVAFLVVGLVYQLVMKGLNGGSQTANNTGGF
jgi:hypothetical protein